MDSFEAENFRSLKHLKLEKLARVNLLVGKNNSGKTSVLEGMSLFAGTNAADWLDRIDDERHLSAPAFDSLFYQFDTAQPITLEADIMPSHDKAHVLPNYLVRVNISALPNERTRNALPLPGLLEEEERQREKDGLTEPLKRIKITAFKPNSPVDDTASTVYSAQKRLKERNQRRAEQRKSLSRPAFGHWLGTTVSITELYHHIEYLQIRKQDSLLLKLVQQIDPRIGKIVLASENAIYFDLGAGFPDLLPINLVGDGVQRLLAVAAAMAHTPGAVAFIDEIDNGLHYSALRILWKGILQAAREYDVQIVATTHSAEALRHLTWVLNEEENASYRADVAAYTLIRADNDTVRSYRHDYEQLDYALERGIEVRN